MPPASHAPTLAGLRPGWRACCLAGGLSLSGFLSLLAIACVLVFVSVPRLRSIAVHENEVDARATALSLATAQGPSASAPDSLAALLARPGLSRELLDTEVLRGGRILRRHGYLFTPVHLELQRVLPGALPESPAGWGILAWPWRQARTGRRVWLATPDGGLFWHLDTPALREEAIGRGELGDLSGWQRRRVP